METQTRFRIHQLVEYIKQDPEFPFDTHDEIEDILGYYNVDIRLDPDARSAIANELSKLVDAAQTSEITRKVSEEMG